ncbi:MAG: type II toxin-antitoxin system prevent-host-death family antitoxin [Deltaproteobacteria bacterium]|nr:type II toxin-antitoxin system prevent-host-death family antitoxin [Deltaproteobacteria bacterium]
MDSRISATDLARKLGDVLGRIRYRGDSFVVERNGEPVARLTPLAAGTAGTLREGLGAWRSAGADVGDFGGDLAKVNRADRPARNPWAW